MPGPNHDGREPRSAVDARLRLRGQGKRGARAPVCWQRVPGRRACVARATAESAVRGARSTKCDTRQAAREGSRCPSEEGKADNFVNESRKSSGLLISCSKVQCETKKSAWGMEPGGKASSRVLPSCGRVVVPSSIRGRGTREGPFFSQLFGMQHRYACASCFLPFSPHLTKTQCSIALSCFSLSSRPSYC